jgi:hypothetical protein
MGEMRHAAGLTVRQLLELRDVGAENIQVGTPAGRRANACGAARSRRRPLSWCALRVLNDQGATPGQTWSRFTFASW